jgi:hypothetical protein
MLYQSEPHPVNIACPVRKIAPEIPNLGRESRVVVCAPLEVPEEVGLGAWRSHKIARGRTTIRLGNFSTTPFKLVGAVEYKSLREQALL